MAESKTTAKDFASLTAQVAAAHVSDAIIAVADKVKDGELHADTLYAVSSATDSLAKLLEYVVAEEE